MQHFRTFWIFLLIANIAACSKILTINQKQHDSGVMPKNVIWFQLADFSQEHLALIKSSNVEEKNIGLENMTCPGVLWNYNLSELRPSSLASSMMQLIGSANVTGSCKDFSQNQLSQFANERELESVVIEHGFDDEKESLLQRNCDSLDQFLKNTWFFAMSKRPARTEEGFFHYREQFVEKPGVYFDKSCQAQDTCHTSLGDNLKYILDNFEQRKRNLFLIIRDNSIGLALRQGKNLLARENMYTIDRIINGLVNTPKLPPDTLILVTGVAPHPIELPLKGNQWAQFEKNGSNLIYKNQSIVAPIYSYGANAENFCGIYSSSDVRHKIFWASKDKKYKFDFFFF